jgi:hypothetical protein
MSYPAARLKLVADNVVRALHPELVEPSTYLTAAVAATGTALTVKSNLGFSNTDPQDLLLFEKLGSEAAEIKRVNGAITDGTSLTSTAVTFAHPIDTPVSKILFDQIEISGASTLAGAKTVIATVGINVTGQWTDYVVAGTTYAYYFARFKNSLSTTPYFGAYSDGIAASGFTFKNVGFIRRQAFETTNEEPGGKFSDKWVYDKVYLGELDIAKRLKRWSWLVEQDYDAGNAATGVITVSLPSNIEDNQTQKSILGLRIGTGRDLRYVGKAEYEDIMEGVGHTTLSAAVLTNDTSVTLTDSRDFDNSGSINIAGTTYTYTTNTRSTGVLSGMTAFSAGISNGTDVWQNITFAEPTRYTVIEGVVYFDVPVTSDLNGRNIWLDYYKTPTMADSDTDDITVNDPIAIQLWLELEIKRKKMNGNIPKDDVSKILFEQRVALLIQNELSGQPITMVPAVPERLSTYGRGYRR